MFVLQTRPCMLKSTSTFSSTQYKLHALTTIPDKHVSTSSVPPQTIWVICTPRALNHRFTLKYTDTHTLTSPPVLAVKLPWATPWWQAIFEVALSRASSFQLYKKRTKAEEKEKYQPVICWLLSLFLSYLLKACLAKHKLSETSLALFTYLFLINTITRVFWF